MGNASNILISIEDRHVKNLLNGTKKIELRRRHINVLPGSKVWIYSKIPTGKVYAYGIVDYIYAAGPDDIWNKYGEVSGISQPEFTEYFEGTEKGCAIVFREVQTISQSLSLDLIRAKLKSFHPPQFFKYLYEDSPELQLFRECALST